ncbi:hypothetical protein [Streptomyces sp. NPDC006739]|uniref:hypothetical protein n=1 Tax=Streptomyces sp. NPDC006739 TaxID=3364763 RepID=UPI0036A2AFDF
MHAITLRTKTVLATLTGAGILALGAVAATPAVAHHSLAGDGRGPGVVSSSVVLADGRGPGFVQG